MFHSDKYTAALETGGFCRILMTLYVYVWRRLSALLQQASKGSRRPALRCHSGAAFSKPLPVAQMKIHTRKAFS